MTKVLIKKQLMEVFAWFYQDKKTGARRDKKGMWQYTLICLLVVGILEVVFYKLADILCAPLTGAGFGWLYMTIMGLVGTVYGVFASVFNTYASLYQAKDNDLLLSMPVPVKSILIARLSGVYAMGFLYELMVMVPAVIVYFMIAELSVTAICFSLLQPVLISFFILTLSCILGWLIAVIGSRLKNQKLLTVFISLLFIGFYYYFCGNISQMLKNITEHPQNFGEKMKGMAYPLYHMGMASEGNLKSLCIFAVMIVGMFVIVYLILKQSFLKLATVNRGAAKVKYVEKKWKASSVERALLQKELHRFFQSTNYMLNCGIGMVFMVIAAAAVFLKADTLWGIMEQFQGSDDVIALVTIAAICMLAATNDMTAPSISLEGKNIWLIQVFPVDGWKVLQAKLRMQILLNLIPAILLCLSAEWVVKPSILFAILIPAAVILYIILMAAAGLVSNLLSPNLKWTNEIVPIKQSFSVIITLFGGIVTVVVFAGIYYLLRKYVTAAVFGICVTAVLLVADMAFIRWLKDRGSILLAHAGNE